MAAIVKRVLTGSNSETVTARLNAAGYVTASKVSCDRTLIARTDSTGRYEFDDAEMAPNALITPAGTAWVITEPGGKVRSVVVPSQAAPAGGWDASDIEVFTPESPDDVLNLQAKIPIEGKATGQVATLQADGTIGLSDVPETSMFDVRKYCKCDGTDDTANWWTMVALAAARVNTDGAASIHNPGLPIGISGPALLPAGVGMTGHGGNPDGSQGSRFVALAADAQVIVQGRGAPVTGITMSGANVAAPQIVTCAFSVGIGSNVVSVTGLSDAQIDAQLGRTILLPGARDEDGSVTLQSVIIATPGRAGVYGAAAASGTLVIASTGASASAGTATIGSKAWVHFQLPTNRHIRVSVINSGPGADGCLIDKISNATFHTFRSVKHDGACLIIDKGSAGGDFVGLTQLTSAGRALLEARDSNNIANEAGNTRNVTIHHAIIENPGGYTPLTNIDLRSAQGFEFRNLSTSMTSVIPPFAVGTTYGPRPGNPARPNVVDHAGAYWQVVPGTANFTAGAGQTPDLDARWLNMGAYVRPIRIQDETESPGGGINIVQFTGRTFVNMSSSNRCVPVTIDGDAARPTYPIVRIEGVLSASGITGPTCPRLIEWNCGQLIDDTVKEGSAGNATVIVGGTIGDAYGFQVPTSAQPHGSHHAPTGLDPTYPNHGHSQPVENIERGWSQASLLLSGGAVLVVPFTLESLQTIVNLFSVLTVIGVTGTGSGKGRLGVGRVSNAGKTYTPIAETDDLWAQMISAAKVNDFVGGALSSARGHGLLTSFKALRTVRWGFALHQLPGLSAGVGNGTAPRFQGASLNLADASDGPWMAMRLGNAAAPQADLPLPAVIRAATVSNGSATVLDAAAAAYEQGQQISGTGVPVGAYVGTVTPGTGYLLSTSPVAQVDAPANANGNSVTVGGPITLSAATTTCVRVKGT